MKAAHHAQVGTLAKMCVFDDMTHGIEIKSHVLISTPVSLLALIQSEVRVRRLDGIRRFMLRLPG
jgi:hypothetical protein